MKLLTLDLEMNKNDKGELTDIIEIGYVITNTRNQEFIHKRSILVKPKDQLNIEIINLTNITQEMIDSEGMYLTDAYNEMISDVRKYGVTTLPAQWGIGDTDYLRNKLGLTWDEFVFRRRAIDVKSIYQAYAAFQGETTVAGLAKAMEKLDLDFNGQQHRAADDAENTWYVLQKLTNKMKLADKIIKAVNE